MKDETNLYTNEEEFPERPLWLRIVLGLVAVIAIGGLLYLSGIYQGSLFRRTPADRTTEEARSVLNREEIALPLQVFVLTGGERLGSLRSEDDVLQLVRNAGAIWRQADIILVPKGISFVDVPDSVLGTFFIDPQAVVSQIPSYDPRHINVFLVRSLSGINGVAFAGLRSTAVADFTTVNDFRTFAHEIGHLLSLGHVQDRARLMAQGTNGTVLSEDEIRRARDVARTLGDG